MGLGNFETDDLAHCFECFLYNNHTKTKEKETARLVLDDELAFEEPQLVPLHELVLAQEEALPVTTLRPVCGCDCTYVRRAPVYPWALAGHGICYLSEVCCVHANNNLLP